MIDQRQTTAKAFNKDVFINQERKLGALNLSISLSGGIKINKDSPSNGE